MKLVKNWIYTIIYGFNLRIKLLVSYLLLIIIPVALLGVLTYSNIHQVVMEQTGNAYLEALKQAEKNINHSLEIGTGIADQAQTSPDIQRILRIIDERKLEAGEEIDFFSRLLNNVNIFENNQRVIKVSYFIKPNAAFVGANSNFTDSKLLSQEPVLKDIVSGERRQGWFLARDFKNILLTQENEVVLVRGIRDMSSLNNVIGYIVIELNADLIWNTLYGLNLPKGGEMVVHKHGELIRNFKLSQDSEALITNFMDTKMSDREGILPYSRGTNSQYAISNGLNELDWMVSLILTEEHMAGNSRAIRRSIFSIASFVAVFAIITAVFISKTITRRLKKLMKAIKNVEKGNFQVEDNVKGNDEHAQLQRAFNRMSKKINELIEEVYKAKISKQEAEMKLLYSQINPHFLYNTLDIIKWNALRRDEQDIAEITESLAKFLRLSLNGGKDNITLSEEVEEVSRYMHIISYRYKGAVKFLTQVQEDIGDIKIIKMILQPLVENSVIHGIRPKQDKAGTIIVRGYKKDGDLILEVIDDGVGIDLKNRVPILESETQGYGVKNVHQRIKVHYGEESGLEYFSRPGIGCCVRIRLRLEK